MCLFVILHGGVGLHSYFSISYSSHNLCEVQESPAFYHWTNDEMQRKKELGNMSNEGDFALKSNGAANQTFLNLFLATDCHGYKYRRDKAGARTAWEPGERRPPRRRATSPLVPGNV